VGVEVAHPQVGVEAAHPQEEVEVAHLLVEVEVAHPQVKMEHQRKAVSQTPMVLQSNATGLNWQPKPVQFQERMSQFLQTAKKTKPSLR